MLEVTRRVQGGAALPAEQRQHYEQLAELGAACVGLLDGYRARLGLGLGSGLGFRTLTLTLTLTLSLT